MKNVIIEAKEKVVTFCTANNISLNQEIINVPVYGLKEFFKERDQSGCNYSEEEAREDLGKSEAFFLQVDDQTGLPAIIYDEERMNKLDFEDKVQIVIHEFLHYNEAIGKFDEKYDNIEEEAMVELLSMLITRYTNCSVKEAFKNFLLSLNPSKLIESYEKNLGVIILWKIYKITEKELKKYIE